MLTNSGKEEVETDLRRLQVDILRELQQALGTPKRSPRIRFIGSSRQMKSRASVLLAA